MVFIFPDSLDFIPKWHYIKDTESVYRRENEDKDKENKKEPSVDGGRACEEDRRNATNNIKVRTWVSKNDC